jgi:acyl-CoA thioester hydrolase
MEYRHTLPIQLRFNDVDTYGHVNNTAYFSYYDLAKTTYMKDIRLHFGLDNAFDSIVVVNLKADFLSPIFGGDNVAVQTSVHEVGNKSFTLQQQVIAVERPFPIQKMVDDASDNLPLLLPSGARTDVVHGVVKCVCSSVMVAFDIKTQTSRVIPQVWKDAFCAFEGHDVIRKK